MLKRLCTASVLACIGVNLLALPAYADSWLCNQQNSSSFSTCINSGYTAHGYENHYQDNVYGAGIGYWKAYNGHNCTNYVGYMLTQNGDPGHGVPMGNAGQWDNTIALHDGGPGEDNWGYLVNATPAIGSIALWDYANNGTGHVAYVEAVNGNTITISEDNAPSYNSFRWRTITTSGDWPDKFLHIKDTTPTPPPDADADTTPDSEDWCPNLRGSATNHGCPLSITQVSGDIDGDGKGDIVAVSRGPNTEPMLSWFQSTGSGTTMAVTNPMPLITLPAPAWSVDGLKWAVGDYNGDGKDDLFVASGSGSGAINMYQLLSTGSGMANPVMVKQPPHPGWQWDKLQYFAGDVDGDTKDDVIAISRGINNEPSISMLRSTSSGSTASMDDPVALRSLSAPAWNVNNLKWAVGDYTGDGKTDVFAASGSVSDLVSMYILKSTGTALDTPVLVKQPNPAAWRWDKLTFMNANIDGDSKDDIAAVSRNPDNSPAMQWFWSTSTGTTPSLAEPALLRSMSAPAWNVSNLKFATIDNNGDGKDDLFAASGNVVDPVSMYVFRTYLAGAAGWQYDTPTLVNQPSPAGWFWVALQF